MSGRAVTAVAEVDVGVINWADNLLKEWGKWAAGGELPAAYVQMLGVRRSRSVWITDAEAAAVDAVVARLEPSARALIKRIYLRGDRIRNRVGWRMALMAFEEEYRNARNP